ncbi:MAG TPA: branched-chain-amino-acid transaminase [Chthoniobacteraceae bacterium]|jgi:branched-chain amino acid aminotransferase|nr:branched-chain-amino-acid transaminase [Chthoniobacteraceae bacterium]
MKIYIDGAFLPEAEAKISVFDHGLLYGDGVFEGIRFYNGRVFRLEEHFDRLWDSAKALCLTIPLTREEMTAALLESVRQNQLRDGYIRLLITRGIGNLGLNPYNCKKASVIIIAASIALYPEEQYQRGLDVITCGTRRTSVGALSPQVKSLNYLNNIMAKIEAIQAGAGEGLMLNEQGYVAECTGDNIFVLKRGQIITPPISAGGLRGITRDVVFEIAREFNIAISEPEMTRYDIYTADECFLTGTAAEIIPVVSLDKRLIGSGKPGPLTARFIARFRELTQSSGTPIY